MNTRFTSRKGVLHVAARTHCALVHLFWPAVLALASGFAKGAEQIPACALFPIALPASALSNATPGIELADVLQGTKPGNFGWLTWAGSPSEATLVASLTAPGNSSTYVNPSNTLDRQVSVGDWVRGKPGVSNSKPVRDALDALTQIDVTVPVWNEARGEGDQAAYHISALARLRLLNYQLPGQNRIGARFLGYVPCADENQPPLVDAGPDLSLSLPAGTTLNGSVSDDGLPLGGALTQSWSVITGPGAVTFGDSNSPVTTATFSLAGTYVLRLTANDSQLTNSDEIVVLVNRENHPPLAQPQALSSQEDHAVVILLLATDPDGDPLAWFIDAQPPHGDVTLLASNAVRYVPDADYAGVDFFTFHASDGLLDSGTVTITVTNQPVNDAPTADAVDVRTDEDTPVPLQLSGSDVEGSPIVFMIRSLPANGSLINTGTSYIYSPRLNFHGTDAFTYVAYDGALTSAVATVSIAVIAVNDRPIVFAGADQFLGSVAVTAFLNGSVDDAEFIEAQTIMANWTVLSGPGAVSFANSNLVNTAATFSTSGVYGLRLTADDGFLNASDELTVTVNQPPVVDAGPDATHLFATPIFLVGTAVDPDGLPTNGTVTVAWQKMDGPGEVTFGNAQLTNTTASFSQSGVYRLRLTATDTAGAAQDEVFLTINKAPLVDAGPDQVSTNLQLTLLGTVNDDGIPIGVSTAPLWTKLSGPGEVAFDDAGDPGTSITFSQPGVYVLQLAASDSLATSRDETTIAVLPANRPPSVSAGRNQLIVLPGAATLNGVVTDDGLPVGGALSWRWSVVSGTGPVVFGNASATNTTATFSVVGNYGLQLTASDSVLTNSAQVTIAVRTPAMNQAPVARAGRDKVVGLTNVVTLCGTVTDDGLPQGALLTTQWSVVSGPAPVTFANSAVTNASAAFTAPGVYVLRLTANDSALIHTDEVKVTVYPHNNPPFVEAGTNQTVLLPDPSLLRADASQPTNVALVLSRSLVSVDHWNPAIGQPGLTGFPTGSGLIGASRNGLALQNGVLFVAGSFTNAEGTYAESLARWDGASWSGFYDPRPEPRPDLYRGTTIGWGVYDCHGLQFCGESFDCVAVRGAEVFIGGSGLKDLTEPTDHKDDVTLRWSGTGWESWGFKFFSGQVRDIKTTADRVYVGGNFIFQPTNASDLSFPNLPISHCLAAWDGTNWSAVGEVLLVQPEINSRDIFSIAIGPTGTVYVAGSFVLQTPVGLATNIARWTGLAWEPVGGGILGLAGRFPAVNSLAFAANGDLYAGGAFTHAGGVSVRNVARWDGLHWQPLGASPMDGVSDTAEAIAIHGRDVYVGGRFLEAGGLPINKIARWNGAFWSSLANSSVTNTPQILFSLAVDDSGLYVGGQQTTSGGQYVNGVTQWEFAEPPPLGVVLHGEVTDDALPTDAPLTVQWTKLSGPGSVIFSNPTGALSHATFTAAGTYVLRLAASDTDLTGQDEVTITVLANQPPNVHAGLDRTTGRNQPVSLAGAVSDDGLPDHNSLAYSWSLLSPADPSGVSFSNRNATNATVQFAFDGTYLLRLTANDTHFSAYDDVVIVVAGQNSPPSFNLDGFTSTVTLPGTGFIRIAPQDDGRPAGVTNILWTQSGGPAPVAFSNTTSNLTQLAFTTAGKYFIRATISDSALTYSVDYQIIVNGPNQPPLSGNLAPLVSAGPDITTYAGRSFALPGVVTDDGLPAGNPVRTIWSVFDGPDRVYFDHTSPAETRAMIRTAGSYLLRLAASDGQLSGFDDVLVNVLAPTNEPPFALAGADLEITRPQSADLAGLVLDDELPLPHVVSATWSKLSGPGNVLFNTTATNALVLLGGDATARAHFSAPGDYVLRLTASDSQFNDFDEINVVVHEGTNAPPQVTGGPDLVVALPGFAILSASSATDDGLPAGALEVSWSKVSGPGTVSFSTLNGIYRAAFSAPGEYVLRLAAADSLLIANDEVTVRVYNAPTPPVVAIHAPLDAGIVTAPTSITGSVQSAILQSWLLEYRLKPADSTDGLPGDAPGDLRSAIGYSWTPLATGTMATTNAPLATFDPTLLLNGIYELRLTATDLVGRTSTTDPVTVIVDRNLKLGHVTLAFNDLTIPVAGLPLQVTRTYDSRDQRMGDFGIGWTLDLKNIRLQKNRHPGRAWDQTSSGGLFPNYCIDTPRPRVVTITFPDGRVQKFELVLAPACQSLSPLIYPDAVFLPIGGDTRGTLVPLYELNGEIVTDEQLVFGAFAGIPGRGDFISFERLINPPPGPADNLLFNPDLFEFTSQDGYRYVLSETNGLRSVTDPNGNTLAITTNGLTWTNALSAQAAIAVSFQRDALGRITNIVDALGHAMSYRYDTNGNLVTFTDRDGNTNGFTYDGRHSLLTLSDGRGIQTLANDYAPDGRLLDSTDALGHTVSYAYDLAHQRTFTTNRLGFVTVNEFDLHGNVVRTINPLGAVSSFAYDENDNLLVKSNANGCACAVSYTYDASDNRLSETDARGNTTTYTYNSLRKILSTREPSGFATTNTYDAYGNLLSTRDSSGQLATFTYNSAGKVTALTDPKGAVTRFAYTDTGFLTNEVNALGHVTDYTVDANGNRLSQAVTWSRVSAVQVAQAHRRSQGWMEASTTPTAVTLVAETNTQRLVMRHEYTPSGWPVRTLYYDGSSTAVAYNQAGQKTFTTNQAGQVTGYQYDDQGRVQAVTHPDGCEERFHYDAEGQLIRSTDRRGFDTRFTYDAAGKLVHTLFADGSQISATYFADGSLRSETAKNGEVTLYEIDADGNRTSVSNSVGITRYTYNYKKFVTSKVDPLGRTNLYEYDALGRSTNIAYANATGKSATFSGKLLISETDQNGRTTSYGYDLLGRLVALTNAAGGVTRYTYDEPGNKTSETDPLGHTTFFEYDSMRRLVRTAYPDGTSQSAQYDAQGRVVLRIDPEGNVTRFGYDAADNIVAMTNALGGVSRSTYDFGGNKLSQTEPDGRTTQFEYDELSRLIRVDLPCGVTESTSYDLAGRPIAKTDANAQTTRFAYDVRNNLVAVVDPLNRTNTFAYDAVGNRLSETDAGGQVTMFAYDQVDRRVRATYADGTTEGFAYDGTGRLVAHTNQQGKVSRFQNDALGRLIAVTDALGRVTRYGYDANGNRIAETNANQFVTRHEYDEMNRHARTIHPDGSTVTFAYDRLGRRVSETDAAGHATFFAFDELGRLTGRQDDLGNITRFGYDPVGRLTSQTDASHQTTTFTYDCLGRRNGILHPDGTSQSVAFDPAGRRLHETDANTNQTFFAYDGFGRLIATTNALGQVTRFGYDALDRLVSRTDALGRTTTFEYDALGRRTRTVHPDGAAETTGYDAKGRRLRDTDPAGHSTFYAYDDNDRLLAVTNALHQVTLYGYDATGRLVTETDALGRVTSFEYDALDRRTRTLFVDGTAQTTTYDSLGRRVSETDQANLATAFGYDAIGRLIAVTNALGAATHYGYDPVGRLIAQTNANGNATTFAYDALGRRIARTLPGGQTERYAYDPAGNLVARTNFNGRTITYAYDALNRIIARIPDAPSLAAGSVPVTYAYNAVGFRTNMTDAGGVTTYAYDVRDRIAAKTIHWPFLITPTILHYAYDTNGNLAGIRSSNPNGTDVTYTNDALNRLGAALDSRLGDTAYHYDPVGNLQGITRPNGLGSSFQYDALYRLTNFSTLAAPSTPLARYDYTVGPAGHRLGATENLTFDAQPATLERAYAYDPTYRLLSETVGRDSVEPSNLPATSSFTYTYDPVGNRLSRTSTLSAVLPSTAHTYDANDRLLADTYDANGNTTNAFVSTPLTGHTNEVFDQFDFEDRLFKRTTTFNLQPVTINLLHDGDGQRVAKTVVAGTNTLTTLYVVDDLNPTGSAQVLEELTSANGEGFAVTRVHTWGHALLNLDQFTGGQWSARFAGHDGQGSVRYLTDTNGLVTDTFDYDAFGNLVAQGVLNLTTGAHEPLSTLNSQFSTPNHHLFRGEQFDPDLSLYYLRARYHNPATGRFWTPDTFEGFAADPASLHLYTFNQNDPVNRLDPSGHISITETLQVSGLAPLVRGAFLSLWDGVNNYAYGMAGGNALKFTTREEAYFIDSLAVGPGWKFGKENFWAAARGAPFLLNQNPNIWKGREKCGYRCIPFDLDVPIYGPSARFPLFEFEESSLYSFAERLVDIGHGSLVGAEFREAALFWHQTASPNWILEGLAHTTGSLLNVTAGAISPAEIIESAEQSGYRAEVVMEGELTSGSSAFWAGLQGTSSLVGDFVGYNSALESLFGVDRRSGTLIGTGDRWSRGLAGGSQLILSAVGARAKLPEARVSTSVARMAARAERKVATLEKLHTPHPKVPPTAPKAFLSSETCFKKPVLGKEAGIQSDLKLQIQSTERSLATQLEFPFTPFVERQTVARDFYLKAGWKEIDIPSHLRGIDFNYPVEVVTIPKGTVLAQHQLLELQNGHVTRLFGNYFATPGTGASELGIYSGGSRDVGFFVAQEDVIALRTVAAPALDVWTVKPPRSFPVQTKGGGVQFFVPNKSSFRIAR